MKLKIKVTFNKQSQLREHIGLPRCHLDGTRSTAQDPGCYKEIRTAVPKKGPVLLLSDKIRKPWILVPQRQREGAE